MDTCGLTYMDNHTYIDTYTYNGIQADTQEHAWSHVHTHADTHTSGHAWTHVDTCRHTHGHAHVDTQPHDSLSHTVVERCSRLGKPPGNVRRSLTCSKVTSPHDSGSHPHQRVPVRV